jgi:hypothetical protein
MKVIEITFKEPARLRVFTDPINFAGASGPHQEIDVAAGEVWFAPRTQGNSLSATANKQIPVENSPGTFTFGLLHDLGAISRTMEAPAQWAQIQAVNKGVGLVPKPQVPLYEAQVIDFEPSDSTHEDYLFE